MKRSLKILATSMVAVACNSAFAQTEGTGKLIPADQWKPVQPGGTSSKGFITTPPIAPLDLNEAPPVGIVRKGQVGQIAISSAPATRFKPIAFAPENLKRGSGVMESLSSRQASIGSTPGVITEPPIASLDLPEGRQPQANSGVITVPPIASLELPEGRQAQVGSGVINERPIAPLDLDERKPSPGIVTASKPQVVKAEEIRQWLKNNPNASDREIRAAMDKNGVTVGQMAEATGLDFNTVQQRYSRTQEVTLQKKCSFKWERQDSGSVVSITDSPQGQLKSSVTAPDVKALGAGARITEGGYSQETSDGRFYNYGPVSWKSVESCHY